MTGSVLAERLAAQLLSGPQPDDVLDVVGHLLAVQAQDPRGARLAIRARSTGLTSADVDRALTEDRSLVVSTLNRGTLHLVRSEDYWWLRALTTPQLLRANHRRLGQEGVTLDEADRGVRVLERALGEHGPLVRGDLRDRLRSAGVRVEGQAFVHIVLLATIRGLVVRGPMVGNDHAFVLVRDWLGGAPEPISREAALGELARRYLLGHGPASDQDLARWAGVTVGDARRGLGAIRGSLADRDDGLLALLGSADPAAPPPFPPPTLLGAFEPTLLGWTSRHLIVGDHPGLVTSNGIFRPYAMVDGRAVATWSLAGGRVTRSAFGPISRANTAALDADAARVLAFLGYGVPAQAQLESGQQHRQ